jgi:hypothetical protein
VFRTGKGVLEKLSRKKPEAEGFYEKQWFASNLQDFWV